MMHMMNDEYHAAKAEACRPAMVEGGAANLWDAHDAYDGATAWPGGGLSNEELDRIALFEFLDLLEA